MSFGRPLLALWLVVAALCNASPAAHAQSTHWQTQAERVAKAVDAAEAVFAKGDIDGGKRAVTEAYFAVFEDTKLEAAIRRYVSAKRAAEIEKYFATLRKAMTAKDAAQVKQIAQTLRDAVAAEAKDLDAANVAPDVFEVNQ